MVVVQGCLTKARFPLLSRARVWFQTVLAGGARAHFSEQRLVIEPIFDYDRETKSNVSHRASDATTDSITSQTEIQEIAMQLRYKVCLKIPDVERKWA